MGQIGGSRISVSIGAGTRANVDMLYIKVSGSKTIKNSIRQTFVGLLAVLAMPACMTVLTKFVSASAVGRVAAADMGGADDGGNTIGLAFLCVCIFS